MKKAFCLIFAILFLFNVFQPSIGSLDVEKNSAEKISEEEISSLVIQGKGYRYNTKGWMYLYIEGDAYERGYQHGSLLSAEIADLVNRWAHTINNYDEIKRIVSKGSDELYDKVAKIWWDFCKKECTRIYWDKYPEEFQNEVEGIADGAADMGAKVFNESITYQDVLASNMMYEFISKITQIKKGIHPIRTLFGELKRALPELNKKSELGFVMRFINQEPVHHCSGFIATGNATTHGQIVASDSMWCGRGSWWWTNYIALRWNLILDINPTEGNRIVMSSAPGYIWSDHDYYQNDNGIVLIETTCEQGLWDNRRLPLAVRARNAMQYGDSVDEAIDYLITDNDGSMNAVWLVGDTKTGEIARLDLGLYNHKVYRTFDGFFWSANNPMDFRVRLEKLQLTKSIRYFVMYLLTKDEVFKDFDPRYTPNTRDILFEELGNKYYGQIDVDIVKEIMSTHPISGVSTDCKLADSEMINESALWAFFGKIKEKTLEVENFDTKETVVEKIPPCGWIRMHGIYEGKNMTVLRDNSNLNNSAPDVLWQYDTQQNISHMKSQGLIIDDMLYLTTTSGKLFVFDLVNQTYVYNITIGKNPTDVARYNNYLFIGTYDGLKIFDTVYKSVGSIDIGSISSKPVIYENMVLVGNDEGEIYCINADTAEIIWTNNLSGEIYISESSNNHIFVNADDKCYKINIETGDIIWFYETGNKNTVQPVIYNEHVYFGSWDNYFYALSESDGELFWRYETGWGYDSMPTFENDLAYIGGFDQNLYALNVSDGGLRWFFSCSASIRSNPAIYDNKILFGADDGQFYCLNKSDEKHVWSFSPAYKLKDEKTYITTPIDSNPIIHDENVIIGISDVIYEIKI